MTRPDRIHLCAWHCWRALTLLGAVLALAACGTTADRPAAPIQAPTADHLYQIGPLDTLNIVVWRNPELSATVTVRPDGRISTPLVDDVVAAGRSPAELSRDVEKALSRLVRDPVVTIIVSGFQGNFSEQIRVVGEAARPQAVPFRQGMSILDVMILAGGLTDFADGNRAVLIRGAEGGREYSVRLRDLLRRGDISANVSVKPGDIVIVPQSWF
jgi:polysaccharide biosynthesis/export protein